MCRGSVMTSPVIAKILCAPPKEMVVWQPEYRKNSATRQGWSKGIGGGDAFMKRCASSSGCEARPAKGEPARAGRKPCDGLGNGVGEAEAYERVGHGDCG